MEAENLNQETQSDVKQTSSLHQVTPLSKYLAMALFIILPFLGGYVGYTYAPEKVVEVVRVVEVEKDVTLNETDTINNPVIAFEREGLLSGQERELLNERFLEPYVDYHRMFGDSMVLTTVIEVPQEQGESYVVSVVTVDGNAGGFLFGERGGDYNYWTPGCAYSECEFTDEYARKHPEVIEQYRVNIQP